MTGHCNDYPMRAAFLREACGEDDGLRHDVEAILAHTSRAEMFLEQPVTAVAAQVIEASTDAVWTGGRLNALVIGPFAIGRESLSEGCSAAVPGGWVGVV